MKVKGEKMKNSEKYAASNRTSSDRSNCLTGLCMAWLRAERPDVFEALREESFKKYPSTRTVSKYADILKSIKVK